MRTSDEVSLYGKQTEKQPMKNIRIDNLSKSFGQTSVIEALNLQIEEGEFVVLVGPSGCGKSTLLRVIAGLEAVTGGNIEIGGRVVTKLEPKDRDIAMVFQNYALYPHMTVMENMGFSLKLGGASREELRAKVRPAADILGLSELLDRYPRQLSGGQRQRVAMGRAIVRKPAVFLFDEPLSNLDASLRVAMRTEIKALHQRLQSTIIYVTHDQIEAMTMADKIVVMNKGRVEQVGSPLDLYDDPENLFVAGFIGSPAMNFFKVRLENGQVILADGKRLPLTGEFRSDSLGEVVCGVRPDQFTVSASGSPTLIDVIEPTGSETFVHFSLGGTPTTAVFKERIRIQEGKTLNLSVHPSALLLFEPATGARIRVPNASKHH